MDRRLGHRRCKEKQRELDFFSLERGRLQRDLIAVSHPLPKGKGFLEKIEPGFPQRCTGEGQGAMGTTCGKRNSNWTSGENSLPQEWCSPWIGIREVVVSLALDIRCSAGHGPGQPDLALGLGLLRGGHWTGNFQRSLSI